jgi:hypothetical protein
MLVYPDQSMHALRMLVPRCWHNEKGMLVHQEAEAQLCSDA